MSSAHLEKSFVNLFGRDLLHTDVVGALDAFPFAGDAVDLLLKDFRSSQVFVRTGA